MLPSGNDASLVLAESIGSLLALNEWKNINEFIYDKDQLYNIC